MGRIVLDVFGQAEQPALRLADAQRLEYPGPGFRLDAFCRHGEPQGAGQRGEVPDDQPGRGGCVDAPYQAVVDLDAVQWQFERGLEIGITDAEYIYMQLDDK